MSNTREDHVEALLAEIAIQVPEMAPALARIRMEVVDEAGFVARLGRPGIAAIRRDGQGYILDRVVDEDPHKVKMLLAHEALHLVVERVARIEDLAGGAWDGDHMRANIAADRWINQILCDVGLATPERVNSLGGVLPPDNAKESDIMDLWRLERAQGKNKPKNSGKAMAGCTPDPGGDEAEGEGPGEGDNPGEGQGPGPEDMQRHTEAHAIMAGLASMSPAVRKLVNPPPPKSRWQDVVREAASCARGMGGGIRPRNTRAKLGRRSTEEVPKAGHRTRKPQLVVVVDISGSMSGLLDDVIREASAVASLAKVHLVLHDASVLFSGQWEKGKSRISPAGGTTFGPAIEEAARVARGWDGESVVVHLTDGFPCDSWPHVPQDFRAGYAAIFGGYEVQAPGRWRTRHVDKVKK